MKMCDVCRKTTSKANFARDHKRCRDGKEAKEESKATISTAEKSKAKATFSQFLLKQRLQRQRVYWTGQQAS
jgi:hypothetical protein